MALLKLFPGAVYSHGAQSFLIEDLDAKARIAWAVPRDPRTLDFYTEVRDHTRVKVQNVEAVRKCTFGSVEHGIVQVSKQVYGYRRKRKKDHELVALGDLSMPSYDFTASSAWIRLRPGVLGADPEAAAGALHALEHALLSLLPLHIPVDPREVACQCTRRDGDALSTYLLLFEAEGGLGLMRAVR